MQLVFITHHSLFDLRVLSPAITYVVLGGGLYGAARLVWDALGALARVVGWLERDKGVRGPT